MTESISGSERETADPAAEASPPTSAVQRLLLNLVTTPRQFRESVIRHGRPTSDRAASEAVFSNVFLHILPTRIHRYSLQIRATLGLGIITLVLFLLLVLTGIALMVLLQAVDRPGIRLDEGDPIRRPHGTFHAQHPPLGGPRHGGLRDLAHGPRVLHGGVQGAAPVQLGGRHDVVRVDAWAELYRIPVALGPTGILGGDGRLGDCPFAARSDRCAGH